MDFPQITWLAMKSSKPREWTELEVKTLISMSGQRHSAEEISKSLGRYVGSVKTKARELGLVAVKKRSKARRWGANGGLLEMEEALSRVEMAIIQGDHGAHAATRVASEGNRQNDVAQAILAGDGSATVATAVRTAEIAHYRRIIASCLANGLSSSNFT